MKKNHFWFMIEGLLCGVLQIAVWEFAGSVYYAYTAWRAAVPVVGVLLSAAGFFLLMRRFPGMKRTKYGLGFLAYAVTLPAWLIYRTVLGIRFFPVRELAEGEGVELLQYIGVYALTLILSRAVIVLYYYIKKKCKKSR